MIDARNDHALKAAFDAAEPGNTAGIVIFGGDGTVSRCLHYLAGRSLPVAVFPAGTVNDLALMLGMTERWQDFQALLTQQSHGPMPLVDANDRALVIYGSLGLGAESSNR